MKKNFFILSLVFILFNHTFAADGEIGAIESINNAKKEITVKINSGKSVKMGDTLEVVTDEGKIYLNVKYPMMTIALCKIQGKGNLSSIQKDMPVYIYGKSPENNVSGFSNSGTRLADNRNGIIKDNTTGLMWLKDANHSRKSMTWDEAMDFIENLDAAGYKDWRMPTKEEFEYFMKMGQKEINNNFDNVQNYYWTSSEYPGSGSYAWVAGIVDGTTDYNYTTNDNYVWAVRDGKGFSKKRVRQVKTADNVVPAAEKTCAKHNEDFVSYKIEMDAFSESTYKVTCRKGKNESIYKLKYDKIFGSWTE